MKRRCRCSGWATWRTCKASSTKRACRYLQSLQLYRDAGDRWGAANVLSNLCLTLRRQGEFVEAKERGLESLAIRREIGVSACNCFIAK